jgi:hypothetical protein
MIDSAGGIDEAFRLAALLTPPHARRARLLAGARIAVQRASLNRLVDRLDELAVLGIGLRVLARGDGVLEAAEVRLDPRRVATVLEPLTLGAKDPLLL